MGLGLGVGFGFEPSERPDNARRPLLPTCAWTSAPCGSAKVTRSSHVFVYFSTIRKPSNCLLPRTLLFVTKSSTVIFLTQNKVSIDDNLFFLSFSPVLHWWDGNMQIWRWCEHVVEKNQKSDAKRHCFFLNLTLRVCERETTQERTLVYIDREGEIWKNGIARWEGGVLM